MKRLVYIAILIFVWSCNKQSLQSQQEQTLVVQCVLEQGASRQLLKLSRVHNEWTDGQELGVSQAVVKVRNEDGDFYFSELDTLPGIYVLEDAAFVVSSGSPQYLEVVAGNETLWAHVTVPPAFLHTPFELVELFIDTLSEGNLAFDISWTPAPGNKMVLELEGGDPSQPIPFVNELVSPGVAFSGPIADTTTTIFDRDFELTGMQEIKLFRINQNYASLFTFNPSPLESTLFSLEENVSGGLGYFTAVSSGTVLVNVVVDN